MNYAYQGRICKELKSTQWAVFTFPPTDEKFEFCGTPYWAVTQEEALDYIKGLMVNKPNTYQYVIKYFPTTHLG